MLKNKGVKTFFFCYNENGDKEWDYLTKLKKCLQKKKKNPELKKN